MAKKKASASSRPGKLISVSAESMFSKPLTKKQKALLSRIAKRQAAGDDSEIDYSDIPALTDQQLTQFRRAPNSPCLKSKTCSTENVLALQSNYGDGHPETAREARGLVVRR